jgi:hypothetical protein
MAAARQYTRNKHPPAGANLTEFHRAPRALLELAVTPLFDYKSVIKNQKG